MINLNSSLIIKANEIKKVIAEHNLQIYKNIWHYSFNDDFQNIDFKFIRKKNEPKILYSTAYNSFSPLLIYSDSNSDIILKEMNAIQNSFDSLNKNYRHIFWYLKFNDFHDFLEKRSKNSSKPKKHFPTLESYDRYKNKINNDIIFNKFDEKFFVENYDRLKLPEHLSGKEVIEKFKKNNPHVNNEWFRIATLNYNNSIVAIAILIDDNKSMNLENIAAERSAMSFGVFLCTEIVKYCCENNYYSFDAGVSGLYGNYKEKIFLNSSELLKKKEEILLNILVFGKFLIGKN